MQDDVNVRAARFLLAEAMDVCKRCRGSTRLFALALPPGHETLAPDEAAEDADRHRGDWIVAAHAAFVFYVERMSDATRRSLAVLAPAYAYAFCEATQSAHWTNHCERCGSPFDDHELFCEPEGAFLPTNEADAAVISLCSIEQAFQAAAGGYAHEPQFFDAMDRR